MEATARRTRETRGRRRAKSRIRPRDESTTPAPSNFAARSKPDCRPEPEFLLECARAFLRPAALPSIPDALEWPRFVSLCEKHSVGPLVCSALQDRAPAALRDSLRRTAACSLALSAELGRLLEVFQRERIPIIPLKGPALAVALYGNLALRAFSDLDLLARPEDVLPAKRILENHGYRLASTLHWPCDSACFRARESQLCFANGNAIAVDLHWHLWPDYFPPVFQEEHIWKRAREIPFAGRTAATLCSEHQALFLSAHGAKHIWERLGWLCDFARLIQMETSLDWDYVFGQARQTGTLRMVALALSLARDMLGVELPAAAQRFPAGGATRALVNLVRRRFLEDAPIPAPALESTRFSMRAFQRTAHRLRYLCGSLTGPSEAEYRTLRLPPRLHWLYYSFRPLRIAVKYARDIV